MRRGWITAWGVIFGLGVSGCASLGPRADYEEVVRNLRSSEARPPGSIPPGDPAAIALDPPRTPDDLLGPRPVDAFIRRALVENRTVQAARYNVMAMKARIPQVTALEDPMAANTIYPIPERRPPVFVDRATTRIT